MTAFPLPNSPFSRENEQQKSPPGPGGDATDLEDCLVIGVTPARAEERRECYEIAEFCSHYSQLTIPLLLPEA